MILVMSQKLFIKIFLIHWKFILFSRHSHVPPPSKKIQKKNSKNKKEEINLEIEIKNSNPKISLKNEKKFSFTKSKKLIRKKSEKDLKEIYLLAGTAHNEEKLFSYNDVLLLTYKNSYSNGIGGDTTITNNNNNLSENKKENTILYG